MVNEDRATIGLTKIWDEGQGVDKVSLGSLVQHVVRRAIENITRSPVTATLTVVTIAIALFLLGTFILLTYNFRLAVSKESAEVVINVFFKDTVSESDAKNLIPELQRLLPDGEITYIGKSEALSRFKGILGNDAVILEGLDAENPLPASLDVIVQHPQGVDAAYSAIMNSFGHDPRIEAIRYSRGVADQLKRILGVIEFGGAIGVGFLLVLTGFIIANTIKLALYSHRVEVEIMQLVGARQRAIFAPYMLEGLMQGVAGAILGLVLVFGVYLFAKDALVKTDLLQFIFPLFTFLPSLVVLGILCAGGVVGMCGSFLAVRRFLAEG